MKSTALQGLGYSLEHYRMDHPVGLFVLPGASPKWPLFCCVSSNTEEWKGISRDIGSCRIYSGPSSLCLLTMAEKAVSVLFKMFHISLGVKIITTTWICEEMCCTKSHGTV